MKLKPCPFCGASADVAKADRGMGYYAGCTQCQGSQFGMTREDAVRLWDARAAVPEEGATDVKTVLILLDGFKDDSPVSEVRAMLKRQFGDT